MTDITHSNTFVPNPNYDANLRLRRILDEEVISPRDVSHEVPPWVEPKPKSGGQAMIEATIGHVDQATDLVIDTLDRLITEIERTREILQTSRLQSHDVLRNHMIILEMASNSAITFAQQFVDATAKLAARNGQ